MHVHAYKHVYSSYIYVYTYIHAAYTHTHTLVYMHTCVHTHTTTYTNTWNNLAKNPMHQVCLSCTETARNSFAAWPIVQICMRACKHNIYIYIYTYIHMLMHIHMPTCASFAYLNWMHRCIHIWIHTHRHTQTYIRTCRSTILSLSECSQMIWGSVIRYTRMQLCMYVCMHVCSYACMHVCVPACMCINASKSACPPRIYTHNILTKSHLFRLLV